MRNFTLLKRKGILFITSFLLVFSLILAPISSTLEIRRAEAQWSTFDIANFVKNTMTSLSSAATASGMGSLVTKEYILDTIGWGLVNLVLQEMIRSVTQWVNSGFQGSPAFLQDMGAFLTNIADKVAGNFIYGAGLGALCSPFKLNIQVALDIQYRKSRTGGYQSQCRLSSVVNNIEKFVGGDFLQGGWNGWYDISVNPSTNPYATYLEAESSMTVGISNAQGKKLEIVKMGKGFFSKEVCTGLGSREKCSIVTPGDTINASLNNALNIPNGRLTIADELNELIGALFSQLAGQMLKGVGGLLGLTGGGGSNVDYFNQIANEKTPTSYNGKEVQNPYPEILNRETKYRDHQKEIIQLITDAQSYKKTKYGDLTCSTGELTSSLETKLTRALSEKSAVELLIPQVETYSTDYGQLLSSTTPQATISALLIKYNARTVVEAKSKLMTQYSQYSTSGSLHSDVDNVQLELQTIPDLKTEIATFKGNIDRACDDNNGR